MTKIDPKHTYADLSTQPFFPLVPLVQVGDLIIMRLYDGDDDRLYGEINCKVISIEGEGMTIRLEPISYGVVGDD